MKSKLLLKMKSSIKKTKNTDFYQMYKEEMIVVPLLILAFYLFNILMVTLFPRGAFFDFYSEIETIITKILIVAVSMWTAHLALRVSFPRIYKFLHDELLHKFDTLPQDKKLDYAVKFILVFILSAAIIFGRI